jgi:amino acid permease
MSNASSFLKETFEPGAVNASIFCLISTIMGAGTLTMPYIFSLLGVGLGALLIFIGALISFYSGMLIVKVSEITGR